MNYEKGRGAHWQVVDQSDAVIWRNRSEGGWKPPLPVSESGSLPL